MITKYMIQTSLLNTNFIEYTIVKPKTCEKTVFWLHGYQERADQLLKHELWKTLAETYHAAIVFPDVPDTYYLNQSWNDCYTEEFLISKLIPTVQTLHELPSDKESTFLAGISMGGFGSLLLGSHHPQLFCKIGSISGAFILDDVMIGNPEVIGDPRQTLEHFRNLFGDIPSLDESRERNPLLAAQNALEQNALPPIFLGCGTDDLLYTRNRKLYRMLSEYQANITWTESPGDHEWSCFETMIPELFRWFFE